MSLSLTKLDNITLDIITILNSISFMSDIASTSGGYIVTWCTFYFYKVGEIDHFFTDSGDQLEQSNRDQFHYHRTVFSSHSGLHHHSKYFLDFGPPS
jgi:hypothetical protein